MNIVRLLGSSPVTAAWDLATAGRLRVLTYHRVPHPQMFAAQLDHIASRYNVVTATTVADSVADRATLPRRSLWITIDDGDISVIRHAMPLLAERGLPATAFVCGGWIDTDEMPWWEVLDVAIDAGLVHSDDLGSTDRLSCLRALKQGPDERRREVVREWSARCRTAGVSIAADQWTQPDLRSWLDHGNQIGNHSWDHPCIDRCDPSEQVRQVTASHERLTELLGEAPDVFAWPNGDPSAPALGALRGLGYRLVLDCDHRLCGRTIDPWAVSRLRIDSDADLPRARAIMSGAHSSVFHLAGRMRRGGTNGNPN